MPNTVAPPWSPSPTDHLIFKWIKLEGKSQSWVASAFGVSQPTISRIIQRYERWQAHATERQDGRLDHSERLRTQRWLTFERNEVFLASCIRIAQEMEGVTELSKETVSRSSLHPNDPGKFRTETASIDRSGVAARFLRLAFRINMEQLKLASLDPAPPALPLSAEELADLDRDAAETAQQLEAAKQNAHQQAQTFAGSGWSAPAPYPNPDNADTFQDNPFSWPIPPAPTNDTVACAAPTTPPPLDSNPPHSPTLNLEPRTLNSSPTTSDAEPPTLNLEPGTLNSSPPANLTVTLSPTHPPSVVHSATVNVEPETSNSAPPIHAVNNLNNSASTPIGATPTRATSYEIQPSPENFSRLNNDYPSNIPLSILMPPPVGDSEALAQQISDLEALSPHHSALPSRASP